MTEVRPGVWRLRVYAGRRANGTPIQIRKTVEAKDARPGAGKRLAERELASMVAKVANGNVHTGSETLEDLLNAWLDHIRPNRSPTTIRKYRDLADRIVIPDLGKVRLQALTARQLDTLYGKLTAKGNKATSVRRVHALIAAALHQAERWDMVDHSVARKASPPPIRQEPVKAPTPDEVRAIVAKAEEIEPALAALLLLGALTGARRGELCALRWTDLNAAERTLTIARSVYETEGGGWAEKDTKTHQERTVGLDELALSVLAKHRAQVDEVARGSNSTFDPTDSSSPAPLSVRSRSGRTSSPNSPRTWPRRPGSTPICTRSGTSRPPRPLPPDSTPRRWLVGSVTATRRSPFGSTPTSSRAGTGTWPTHWARRSHYRAEPGPGSRAIGGVRFAMDLSQKPGYRDPPLATDAEAETGVVRDGH
jgi:integrase